MKLKRCPPVGTMFYRTSGAKQSTRDESLVNNTKVFTHPETQELSWTFVIPTDRSGTLFQSDADFNEPGLWYCSDESLFYCEGTNAEAVEVEEDAPAEEAHRVRGRPRKKAE